jgi:hypothetical protein
LEFDFLRLDRRRARAVQSPVPYPSGDELTVDCEYLPGTRLNILSRQDGSHAEKVQLVIGEGSVECALTIPLRGAQARMQGGLSSPIDLDDQDGTQVYFVRTLGSAWARVAIDHEGSGERTVFLWPGGGVEFQVHARQIDPSTRLRVYPTDVDGASLAEPIAECGVAPDGRAVLEGLREGDWEVRAELGPGEHDAAVLGTRRFVIVRGQTSRVEVPLAEAPTPEEPVRVHGVILVPEPIEDVRCALSLEAQAPWQPEGNDPRSVPLAQMSSEPGAPLALSWDAGLLTPGTWKAQIRCVQWAEPWQIEPGRENFLLIDLSDLRRTFVQVVDRHTLAPVPVRELLYRRTNPSAASARSGMIWLEPADALSPILLQAIPGPYLFQITTVGSDRTFVEVPDLGGAEGLQLAVDTTAPGTASVSLKLRSHGAPVPMKRSWWSRVEFRDGVGRRIEPVRRSFLMTGLVFGDSSMPTFVLPRSGPVRILFPPAEDFREIVPLTATVSPGETVELTVELDPAW